MTSQNGQITEDSLTSGNQNGATKQAAETTTELPKFAEEQAVVLKPSPLWTRGIVWGILGVTVASLIWSMIATIEQTVPARGQLKPQGTVKEIQTPITGSVVEDVFIENGDKVKAGQTLVKLDPTTSVADLQASQKVRQSLAQQNQLYRAVLAQLLTPAQVEAAIAKLRLPPEKATLVRERTEFVAENQLYKIQLGSIRGRDKLTPTQAARLRVANAELGARAAVAQLEISQIQKQLEQNQVQLADSRLQVLKDQQIINEIQKRNRDSRIEAQKSLEIDEQILGTIEPLLEEGALAKLQVENQKQRVYERRQSMIDQGANGVIQLQEQRQQHQARQAEIERLEKEKNRLNFDILQSKKEFLTLLTSTEKEVRDLMANNDKRIAQIDTNLTQTLIQNENRIADLDSQISRAKFSIKYQELKAPVNGTVFDLKASPGYVPQAASTAQSDPLLKIVPDDYLVAEVDITNQDIGFVRIGMKTDVRIDSFPYSEFGDVKGTVSWISSDALEPDQINQFYRFPAKITLDSQVLETGDRKIPLQSGMSVTANIKVREKRTVMSLFWEMFTAKVESLEQVR